MALNVTSHGSCCGACVVDGFHDQDTQYAALRVLEYSEEHARRTAFGYPTHAQMIDQLHTRIREVENTRGQITVILNENQNPVWQKDLEAFGFKLIWSDVANPNHHSNELSRLFTYLRPSRPYKGDREDVGLPAEEYPVPPNPTSRDLYPPAPVVAPPPIVTQPVAAINWGVPI